MKVTVVCPFYNEESIIEKAVQGMLESLARLSGEWELVLVDDGSTDAGLARVRSVVAGDERVRVLSYAHNQGRGYALKHGIDAARGEIVVTTEIDLSWGDTIVADILAKFEREPQLDVVVASPHLRGGGYRNVPVKRVWLSRLGNEVLQLLFTKKVTMNTGMTRGYRRRVIQSIRTEEKGKEFHLEVLLKLVSLGYQIGEIPATLEWKTERLARSGEAGRRKSSSKINALIRSHLNFAIFANPIRYFGALSVLCLGAAVPLLAYGTYKLIIAEKAIFYGITGLFLCMFSLMFLGFGVVAAQNNKILKEMWRFESERLERERQRVED